MNAYKHVVQYYETDKMGITHHSNYIKWMEEARIDFLNQIGWSYARLESDGIVSPVVEATCRYKKSTTFSDEVFITVTVSEYRGVRLVLAYDMKDADGNTVATATSQHCFMDKDGKLVRLAKDFPELDQVLTSLVGENEK